MKKSLLVQSVRPQPSGFTLIELLLYIAIVGTLLVAVTYFSALTVEARIKNQSITEVDQQGIAAMDAITQTIRNATSITSPGVGTNSASLTLAVPTSSLSPTVFDTSSGSLEIKEGTASPILLTNNKVQVTSVTFTNLSRATTPGIVRISLTLQHSNPSGRNEYSYQKTFTGSAEVGW